MIFFAPTNSSKSQSMDNLINLRKFNYHKWMVLVAATLGYGLFYVCRLSFSVLKSKILEVTDANGAQYLTESEVGIIGSALFFSYAAGKFVNGFLADRVNVRWFMGGGLLIAALVNAFLGFKVPFWAFILLWGVNGWVQSVGAPSCVIALKAWFPSHQLGTVYGFWSSSHNIGTSISALLTAFVATHLGWQYGFFNAAFLGAVGVALIFIFLRPTPKSVFPQWRSEAERGSGKDDGKAEVIIDQKEVSNKQRQVLKMPIIWVLALSSAFMYISRYALDSWGIFYLEQAKGYTNMEAAFIYSIAPGLGVVGTIFSGFISDLLFKGKRERLTLIASVTNLIGLLILLYAPLGFWGDITAMVLFGISIGILICLLGGLMAVDLAPAGATGAAMGVIGVASYLGAALQDITSGALVESRKTVVETLVNGIAQKQSIYNFDQFSIFWTASAAMSTLLLIFIVRAYNKKSRLRALSEK